MYFFIFFQADDDNEDKNNNNDDDENNTLNNIKTSSHLSEKESDSCISVCKLLSQASFFELLGKASSLRRDIILQGSSLKTPPSSQHEGSIFKLEKLLEDSLRSVRSMKLKTSSLKLSRKLQDDEVASLIQPRRLVLSSKEIAQSTDHETSSVTANPDPLPEEVASSSELNTASFASENSSYKESSSFRSQEPHPDPYLRKFLLHLCLKLHLKLSIRI